MNNPQDFHMIVTCADGKIIDVTTGHERPDLAQSANFIAGGELGIAFAGHVVSAETQLCFIPDADDEVSTS